MSAFTHLHVHSHYTLLGALPAVETLVATAQGDGLTHLALTDHSALYGVIAFSQACRTAEIEPILGMTLLVQLPAALNPRQPDLFMLLATEPAGYRSLCRLSSLIQGQPEREALQRQGVTWEQLKEHREGLIAISGGRRSLLEACLRRGDGKAAANYLSRFAGLFDERGYLALELHTPVDIKIAQEVTKLGDRFGLPCLAVQPIYSLTASERPRLRLLAAIDHNCRLEEVPAAMLPDGDDPTVDLHWLHPGEMRERFANFPAALAATQDVAAQCKPALPDGRPIFPILKLAAGMTPELALRDLAETGARTRFTDQAAIQPRLEAELAVIVRTGYATLFLMVADVVRYARSQQIPVSTRGSVANSLVAYCAGITTVDPIAHNLLFERFLNPERSSPPDIDLDFCSVRRDEVLNYVRDTYGADKVALVATISTMRPRSAVGETAKAFGMSEEESNKLVKMLPDEWHPDPRRRVHSVLDTMLEKVENDAQRKIVTSAFELIGQPHHLSLHPGGVVVTPGPLTDLVPLQWTPKGFLTTQYDHEHVEAIGLPKLDLLGIRALTVMAASAALIRQHHDPAFQLETIPLDDADTASLLASGDTVGVFQCESSGARRTLRQLKAHNVQDLAVANAFFKPGPATGGMAASFVRRYRGEERASYLHPALEPILGFTQGVLIFQEQVLRVGHEIAGLSWGEADYLRKGMSKFQADAMAKIRSRFLAGCIKISHFSQEQATMLWEQVEAFAGYGFNQGHATAYADVSYRSAWLKVHYPAAFLAARLANYGGFHHPAIYIAEAQRLGILVRPPHVNHSGEAFTLALLELPRPHSVLWMGLGQVRGLRQSAIEAIIMERGRCIFSSLDDLRQRVELQPKEVLHLIQCGALDGLADNRMALLAQSSEGGKRNRSQLAFDFAAPVVEAESVAQRFLWEKEILGQPLSVNPLQTVKLNGRGLMTLDKAAERSRQSVQIAGYRLPGWTGGKGFYLSDGQGYAVALVNEKAANPKTWLPVLVRGRWQVDEWGGGALQVEQWEVMAT